MTTPTREEVARRIFDEMRGRAGIKHFFLHVEGKPTEGQFEDHQWWLEEVAASVLALFPSDTQEEIKRLESVNEALKLQAECWAMEARAHKSSLHEAYQAITGGNGEPGNWNGAKPIIEAFQSAEAERDAALRENAEALAEATRLAKTMHANYYNHVTQWRPFDEVVGVITQIDNMVAGLASRVQALETEMNWIAMFADLRSKDESKVFARVNRGALRNIAERIRSVLDKTQERGGDQGVSQGSGDARLDPIKGQPTSEPRATGGDT